MKRFFSKYGKRIAIMLTVVMGVVLLVLAIVMLVGYRDEIADRSESKAQYYTLLARNHVEQKLGDYVTQTVSVANTLAEMQTKEDVYEYLGKVSQRSEMTSCCRVRYFCDGVLCESNGDVVNGTNLASNHVGTSQGVAGYLGSEEIDVTGGGQTTVMTFYAPVSSGYANGLVLYLTGNVNQSLLEGFEVNEYSEMTALCNGQGYIVDGADNTSSYDVINNLESVLHNKSYTDEVSRLLSTGTSGLVSAAVGSERYLISVGSSEQMQDLSLVELYKVDVLYEANYSFVRTIIAIVVTFAIIVIGVIIYLIVTSRNMRMLLFRMETIDNELNCFNRYGFEKEARRIIDRNPNSSFAVVVLHLRHYRFLKENYGESEIAEMMQFLKLTCSRTIQVEETYGRINNGNFLLLLHARDRRELIDRLKVHSFLSSQYKGSNKFDILFRYGICEVDIDKTLSVAQMIDFANEANNTVEHTTEHDSFNIHFYNDELRQMRLANEDMELRMESALQNGEFQIFYQPKYNLNTNKQDSCEALVRWYDAATNVFNPPAMFIQLFESNGFIVKLDKYVYTKVCEYINYAIANGQAVYPISVNISRITAVQPDFLDFYVRTKKKYRVPDGLIMIEFTESFAYENYETLSVIVDQLHKNGFGCSIDDFGSGYSSYKILKMLPMDEIKLDKFFLEKSDAAKRDYSIHKSIIDLAKSLGMKVTQEGVEFDEEIQTLRGFGCDVVQGFIYSKPLPLTDYINFVAKTREHNV